jgi:hypothetical protein
MVQSTSTTVQKKPLPSVGWGCLVTLVFPILLVLAMAALLIIAILIGLVTFGQLTAQVVGIGAVSIAWVTVVFNFVIFTVTKVIVALAVGRLILTRFGPNMKPLWLNIAALLLGALIYEILRIIPVVGWIVALLAILVGLGAMFMAARQRGKPEPLPPLPPTPATEPTFEESDVPDESDEIALLDTTDPSETTDEAEPVDVSEISDLPPKLSDPPDIPDPSEKPDATL